MPPWVGMRRKTQSQRRAIFMGELIPQLFCKSELAISVSFGVK